MTPIIPLLKTVDLFHGLEPADLALLGEVLHTETYQAGEILFLTGDAGDSLYIIQSGRIRIFMIDEDEQYITLRHYGGSEIFGEFSLIDQHPRSASADALEETVVWVLAREDFLDFLDHRPQVSVAMMRTLSQRARYTTHYLEEVVEWTKRLANAEYEEVMREISRHDDDEDHSVEGLVAAFVDMVKKVQAREETLRLKIEIDESKRKATFERVADTGLFERAKLMKEEFQRLQDEQSTP